MDQKNKKSYYIGRIDKLPNRLIKESILSGSWIENRKSNLYKPYEDDSEMICDLKKYKQTGNLDIKNKLFNGLLWYAAYIAFYRFIDLNNYKYCKEFDVYLGHAMERLWLCLDTYDLESNTSFYTYFLNDYKYRLRHYLENEYSISSLVLTRSRKERFISVINKLCNLNMTEEEALKYSDKEFKRLFGITKNLFIHFLDFDISSLNIVNNEDNGCELELQYKLSDKTNYENLWINKIMFDDIISMAKKCVKKHRDYDLWYLHTTQGYTSRELAKTSNTDLSYQRIHQIINNVNKKIATRLLYSI